MKITGTFIDEISHDIPSANWGAIEWAQDFDVMKSIGIDTVILIRCGYKDKATFHSKTLKQHFTMRPVYIDLVDLFLEQAERCGMDFRITFEFSHFMSPNSMYPSAHNLFERYKEIINEGK
ncbi:MAG: DUF4434 domain-containing protein [Chloroflexota bacterium]